MAAIPHTKPVISDGLSIVAMIHYDSNFKQQAPMLRTLGCIPNVFNCPYVLHLMTLPILRVKYAWIFDTVTSESGQGCHTMLGCSYCSLCMPDWSHSAGGGVQIELVACRSDGCFRSCF